jgi:hypothetical protein
LLEFSLLFDRPWSKQGSRLEEPIVYMPLMPLPYYLLGFYFLFIIFPIIAIKATKHQTSSNITNGKKLMRMDE